jgi:hypothetical protein
MIPARYDRYFAGNINRHLFLAKFLPTSLLGISAGICYRALVDESGMIRTQEGMHNSSENGRIAWNHPVTVTTHQQATLVCFWLEFRQFLVKEQCSSLEMRSSYYQPPLYTGWLVIRHLHNNSTRNDETQMSLFEFLFLRCSVPSGNIKYVFPALVSLGCLWLNKSGLTN